MRVEKRKKYQLTPSIHTLEIKSDANEIRKMEKNEYIQTRFDGKGEIATSKINANNFEGDLFTFEHFYNVLQEILYDVGVEKYRLSRADLRLDSEDPEHYRAFEKLNRYLVSALAVEYSVKNTYRTSNLFSDQQVSLAIKNDYFEMEHYDRAYKNQVTESKKNAVCSRLELRSVGKEFSRFIKDFQEHDDNMSVLKMEFCKYWIERLRKATAPESLEKVQERYNQELLKEYQSDLGKKPRKVMSLTDFLMHNQNRIYTSVQMRKLLESIGLTEKQALNKSRNYKTRYGIEYFSLKDVRYAVKVIEKAILKYFQIDTI